MFRSKWVPLLVVAEVTKFKHLARRARSSHQAQLRDLKAELAGYLDGESGLVISTCALGPLHDWVQPHYNDAYQPSTQRILTRRVRRRTANLLKMKMVLYLLWLSMTRQLLPYVCSVGCSFVLPVALKFTQG